MNQNFQDTFLRMHLFSVQFPNSRMRLSLVDICITDLSNSYVYRNAYPGIICKNSIHIRTLTSIIILYFNILSNLRLQLLNSLVTHVITNTSNSSKILFLSTCQPPYPTFLDHSFLVSQLSYTYNPVDENSKSETPVINHKLLTAKAVVGSHDPGL